MINNRAEHARLSSTTPDDELNKHNRRTYREALQNSSMGGGKSSEDDLSLRAVLADLRKLFKNIILANFISTFKNLVSKIKKEQDYFTKGYSRIRKVKVPCLKFNFNVRVQKKFFFTV